MEPTKAAFTTVSNPARSAKMQTNNSGKFPSADCKTPVAAGPILLPNCSVAFPTIMATKTNATAASPNNNTELNPACVANPVNPAIKIAAPSSK